MWWIVEWLSPKLPNHVGDRRQSCRPVCAWPYVMLPIASVTSTNDWSKTCKTDLWKATSAMVGVGVCQSTLPHSLPCILCRTISSIVMGNNTRLFKIQSLFNHHRPTWPAAGVEALFDPTCTAQCSFYSSSPDSYATYGLFMEYSNAGMMRRTAVDFSLNGAGDSIALTQVLFAECLSSSRLPDRIFICNNSNNC